MTIEFILVNLLLGVGLAVDAFSVSIADGLNEPNMKKSKSIFIAFTFGFYQFLMPMLGWVCVHYLTQFFTGFQPFIPWIALGLLAYIGVKMIIEGVKGGEEDQTITGGVLTFGTLMVQGVATAIDALSVGFTIEKYDWVEALLACLIIAVVTFAICVVGLLLGKKIGQKITGKANIFGGVILIAIGLEIFISGVFF